MFVRIIGLIGRERGHRAGVYGEVRGAESGQGRPARI